MHTRSHSLVNHLVDKQTRVEEEIFRSSAKKGSPSIQCVGTYVYKLQLKCDAVAEKLSWLVVSGNRKLKNRPCVEVCVSWAGRRFFKSAAAKTAVYQ